MTWNGVKIVDVSRDFLNTNGCSKHVDAEVGALPTPSISCAPAGNSEKEKLLNHASTLGICLERGLVERFDGSIGASSVFMPFGGKYQLTPDAGHGGHHAGAERSVRDRVRYGVRL